MAISTSDGLVAALATAQDLQIFKSASRTTIANDWFSLFELAGNPGAGVLAGTSTTAGVVPTDATAGVDIINAFGGSNIGYVSRANFSNTVACRMRVYDMLFKAGAYSFNAAAGAMSSQPSYSSRVPGGTDYTDTQIWIECVTAFTGSPTITVTYTNQSGTTGRSTGAFATGSALTLGRCIQLPLQAGDTGVEKIESVTCTVATVGTFNVLVLRPVTPAARIRIANDAQLMNASDLALPQVFTDSALILLVNADSTSSGIPEVALDIING